MRDHFPHISQILEGLHFGANTCRAGANTGKISWQIIYVLVSCQGYVPLVLAARVQRMSVASDSG